MKEEYLARVLKFAQTVGVQREVEDGEAYWVCKGCGHQDKFYIENISHESDCPVKLAEYLEKGWVL